MTFKYSPIDRDSGEEIRLLTLYPGLKGSPIVCSLAHHGLGDFSRHKEGIYQWSAAWPFDGPEESLSGLWVPEYEAISYTWGDQSVLCSIEVNGSTFDVTQNLYSALQSFRKPDQERTLWIDAVCINQTDNEEKGWQIEIMVSIFLRAKEVLVWLGDGSDESDLAMDLIEKLGGSKEQLAAFDYPYEWVGPLREPFRVGEFEDNRHKAYVEFLRSLDLMNPADLDETGLAALASLFNQRTWWMRVWVIQEVTFSEKVTLFCGAKSVSWESVENVWSNPLDQGQDNDQLPELLRKGGCEILIRQRNENRTYARVLGFESDRASLLQNLQSFRKFQSTDPRDKIFALLGLASNTYDMPFPKPDYNKSVSTVYCETARAIIEYHLDLAALCFSHPSQPQKPRYDIPSWVPDWTVVTDAAPVNANSYRASRNYRVEGVDPLLQPEKLDALLQPEKTVSTYSDSSSEHHWRGLINPLIKSSEAKVRTRDSVIRRPERLHSAYLPKDLRVLPINGILWDEVSTVSRSMPNDALETDAWRSVIREWEPEGLKSDPESYLGLQGQSPLKAFWITLMRSQMYMPIDKSPEALEEAHENYHEQYLVWTGCISASEIKNSLFIKWLQIYPLERIIQEFANQIQKQLRGWKFCVTKKGYMGMVPNHAEPGDLVCVFFGADVPLLLRPAAQEESRFTQVGTAYIHGIMSGEVIDEFEKGNVEKRTFHLV